MAKNVVRDTRRTTYSANLSSKQLLLLDTVSEQRQKAVTVYKNSEELLRSSFVQPAVSMPVLDGRRESCSSKTNSSNCLL